MRLNDVPDTAANGSKTSVLIRVADDSDGDLWTGYVGENQAASVFHRWEWRSILTQTFHHKPYYLIAESSGQIVGVFPLAAVKTLAFGHSLVSLPFCSWAGPASDNDIVHDALLTFARDLSIEIGASHLEVRLQQDSQSSKSAQDLYVYFSKTLLASDDENLLAIPRKQRAMVRKGIKNDLTSEVGSIDDFFPMYLDNVHRHGTPGAPKQFFQRIATAFGENCEFQTVRSPQGKPLSTVLVLYHRNEVFPFYAGDVPDARNLAANDFKYWEVMRRGLAKGATEFNYGRSKKGTGSFSFKKNWGFEPKPLSYDFHMKDAAPIPELNPLNPKYQLVIRTWRRMPRWFVGAVGPYLIRGLG